MNSPEVGAISDIFPGPHLVLALVVGWTEYVEEGGALEVHRADLVEVIVVRREDQRRRRRAQIRHRCFCWNRLNAA